MQRVRIGLTGLAFVFLAVLLAMVFTGTPTREEPITPDMLEQQRSGQPPSSATEPTQPMPAEPLAELGVAPGKAESNASAPKADRPVDSSRTD